ncbi:hypothetical protein LOK49_LG07G01264, partial [Camellia lanceoleosa]
VIREIDSILRAFLWSGVDLKKHSAKIAWNNVCRPKGEGGLGFKEMGVWNRAAVAKHACYLFSSGEGSMWCQWVKSYLLKGRSFWHFKIGNGDKVFLWFDNWHPLGSLWNRFGHRILYDTGLSFNSKALQVKCNICWPQLPWQESVVYATKSIIGKTLKSVIMKLSFLGTVYQIWLERNRRIFSKEFKPEVVVINLIVQMVRGRVLSMDNLINSTGDAWAAECCEITIRGLSEGLGFMLCQSKWRMVIEENRCFYFLQNACISLQVWVSGLRAPFSTIASDQADIPQALWTRGRRLHRSEDLVDGQPVFYSLPPIVRRRLVKRSVSVPRLPEQWPFLVRLRFLNIPKGLAPPPILPQLSKAPTLINQPDSPFEFEVDPTALKVSKLEKLFKKSQGVKSIPDIEDGYTDAAVTLPDRFKMPHIDRFDGSGDPM